MSGRSQSIRFVSARIYGDASDRDPFDLSVDLRSVKTLMTVVRRHDVLGSQHFKAAEVFS
ncbi:hypothetical protein EDE08_101331 [Bradyrhizobium sp. R2.2-H]|jgi:hypothetical protein|nr:hypothetical protein EDE10_101331 [Bradyrhizobium sp. Y-H1]TCU80633.1 hypothetical protein EDE08_101331 [Bradyrhizobium sp. R2.2-H]